MEKETDVYGLTIEQLAERRNEAQRLIMDMLPEKSGDFQELRANQQRAIFDRFFLYFCGMTKEMQNECLVKLLDEHVPQIGAAIDATAWNY